MNQHIYQVLITSINHTDGGSVTTTVLQFISETAADNCVRTINGSPRINLGVIEVCRIAERVS